VGDEESLGFFLAQMNFGPLRMTSVSDSSQLSPGEGVAVIELTSKS